MRQPWLDAAASRGTKVGVQRLAACVDLKTTLHYSKSTTAPEMGQRDLHKLEGISLPTADRSPTGAAGSLLGLVGACWERFMQRNALGSGCLLAQRGPAASGLDFLKLSQQTRLAVRAADCDPESLDDFPRAHPDYPRSTQTLGGIDCMLYPYNEVPSTTHRSRTAPWHTRKMSASRPWTSTSRHR